MTAEFTIGDLEEIMNSTIGMDEGVQFTPDDDIPFADRGYDSLAMIELASQLEQRTGIRIPDDVALEQLTSPRRTLEFINSHLASAERG